MRIYVAPVLFNELVRDQAPVKMIRTAVINVFFSRMTFMVAVPHLKLLKGRGSEVNCLSTVSLIATKYFNKSIIIYHGSNAKVQYTV